MHIYRKEIWRTLLIASMVLSHLTTSNCFQTLQEAAYYSTQFEEHPLTDSYTGTNPYFDKSYRKQKPSFFLTILHSLGIAPYKNWLPTDFKDLLIAVVKEREAQGYSSVNYTLSLMAIPGKTQCILFGGLSGAFHSLVRDLLELERQGYINNNLEIIHPHCYIIFNGNVVSGSPYSIETLTLVLELMQRNKNRVIYIKGLQESDSYWKNSHLKRELQAKFSTMSEKIPLERYIDRLFNTLPNAVYLQNKDAQELIRISYFDRTEKNIAEQVCTSPSSNKDTFIFCNKKTTKGVRPLPIRAIIKDEPRFISLENYTGLALLEPDKGATAWSILSSPTRYYLEEYKYSYDSFALLTFGTSLRDTTITNYYQDIRKKSGFIQGPLYQIISGQRVKRNSVPAEGRDPIILGCTLDFTKGISIQSKQTRIGLSLRINKQNEEGGINGRPIKIIYMNDEYTPEKARKNIEQFIKTYKSSLIIAPAGSSTLEAYLDLIKQKKVFVFFPITGASLFRQPQLTNIVHWAASYTAEGQAITTHAIEQQSLRSLAFFYQDDLYGKSALSGAQIALKKAGITQALELPYHRNSAQFANLIKKIQDSSVEGIGFFSTSIATSEFIRQAGIEILSRKKLFGISDLHEDAFKNFIKQKGLSLTLSSFAPNPVTSTLPFVQECRSLAKQQGGINFDAFVLNGYLSADLFIYIIKNIQGPLTHEKIHEQISKIKNQQYKGLTLNYNPQTQELLNTVWLDTGNDTWIEQKVTS